MFQILKNPPEYTMQYSVQPGRNTKNQAHAHLLGNAMPILPETSQHTIDKVYC